MKHILEAINRDVAICGQSRYNTADFLTPTQADASMESLCPECLRLWGEELRGIATDALETPQIGLRDIACGGAGFGLQSPLTEEERRDASLACGLIEDEELKRCAFNQWATVDPDVFRTMARELLVLREKIRDAARVTTTGSRR